MTVPRSIRGISGMVPGIRPVSRPGVGPAVQGPRRSSPGRGPPAAPAAGQPTGEAPAGHTHRLSHSRIAPAWDTSPFPSEAQDSRHREIVYAGLRTPDME